jgi:hypothetical protein
VQATAVLAVNKAKAAISAEIAGVGIRKVALFTGSGGPAETLADFDDVFVY